MRRLLTDLHVAFGFLTRVPVGDPSRGGKAEVHVARAVPWFPLVGAIVGLVQAGVWWGMYEVSSPLLAAAVSTAAALLVTGAFHHDGLADMADAFGGGWTVEQRFEILKDSRLGTYGTAALVMALVIEIVALAEMSAADGARLLVGAHAIGRAAALVVMITAPIAGDGLGSSYARELSKPAVFASTVAAVAFFAAISPVVSPWPLIGAVAATLAVVVLAIRKVGGFTGDVLGAITVVATLACLVVAASLWPRLR